MQSILQACVALLAATGLLTLAWLCFGKLLCPRAGGKEGGPVYAVLPVRGDAATLEHDVRGLVWLRGSDSAKFTIVIADAGLNDQGRSIAHALLIRHGGMALCSAERLGEYIREAIG
ncbi:hypothetical protein D1159_11965 [Pseudoflavonifractor sp. 524-17]|uniref:hypothetical protein n=1 Tax=Pseudoflavonifractor sp. 524-17 TaxID=2304577 RepID=UPI00137A05F4|nr:hypothetical protein [Pseudoflavonifractor sp. 524-17]NCE65273.1 hypothetical protein [Pseudoflavonifractor sp. 524-17]